jgi:hypothetical protein
VIRRLDCIDDTMVVGRRRMTTRGNTGFSKLSLAAALSASVTILVPGETVAQENPFPLDPPATCTLQNVAGMYGFNEDTLSSPTVSEPRARVGILDLKPDGTATIRFRGFRERGGDLRSGRVTEGEWEIGDDCSGFVDFPEVVTQTGGVVEVDYLLVAVENGTELFLIGNNPLEEADAKLLFRR